jgi:hypothetical protein
MMKFRKYFQMTRGNKVTNSIEAKKEEEKKEKKNNHFSWFIPVTAIVKDRPNATSFTPSGSPWTSASERTCEECPCPNMPYVLWPDVNTCPSAAYQMD